MKNNPLVLSDSTQIFFPSFTSQSDAATLDGCLLNVTLLSSHPPQPPWKVAERTEDNLGSLVANSRIGFYNL
jgi:hypothetical protein